MTPDPDDSERRPRGTLRRTLSRWASSDEAHARELTREAREAGCIPIAEAPDRQPVEVRGTLRTVTLRPRGGVPALEAELYDGSGRLTLVWLGRRRIAGIQPGRSLTVHGRIGRSQRDERVIYNPRYELARS